MPLPHSVLAPRSHRDILAALKAKAPEHACYWVMQTTGPFFQYVVGVYATILVLLLLSAAGLRYCYGRHDSRRRATTELTHLASL